MNISISYRHVESQKSLEDEIQRHAGKLHKLLKNYAPDAVQLRGVFSKNPRREEHSFSVNLSLPTGTLHASATDTEIRRSCKDAFAELESQVKKHQSLLRRDYIWKRKRRAAAEIS
jgi:ribosomal subunit interface protein